MKTLVTIIVSFALTSCIYPETTYFNSYKGNNQNLIEFGVLPGEATDMDDHGSVTQLVAVGRTSSLRLFESEEAVKRMYALYEKYLDRHGRVRTPAMSWDELNNEMAGWTYIQTLIIPLVHQDLEAVIVPNQLAQEVHFPHPDDATLFYDNGDLVAAFTNEDGLYVLDRILCAEAEQDFDKCRKRYQLGVFDAKTGVQLGVKLRKKGNGPVIDPETLLLLE